MKRASQSTARARALAIAIAAALAGALASPAPLAADARSLPVDCLADTVASWDVADADLRFGAASTPGIVLGPPGDSLPTQNTTTVASLGVGGAMTWEFIDVVIEDRPGPDFIVFENAFFQGFAPASPDDEYRVFAEPGIVEVSEDGIEWRRFPYDPAALAATAGMLTISRAEQAAMRGLAGITPTFTGNWTIADDPDVFDAAGQGGVSGAGGDAFDLAAVGLAQARFVRVLDAGGNNGFAGAAEGFDVDALVVLHGRPAAIAGAIDADGDRLADIEESTHWGTLPGTPDSDGDGTDDGREVAGCRDPLSSSTAPAPPREPRIFLRDAACTSIRWTWTGTGALYDVVRGSLAFVRASAGAIDLGPLTCLADDTPAVHHSCDAELPAPGEAFFYLTQLAGSGSWGRASSLAPRFAQGGCS